MNRLTAKLGHQEPMHTLLEVCHPRAVWGEKMHGLTYVRLLPHGSKELEPGMGPGETITTGLLAQAVVDVGQWHCPDSDFAAWFGSVHEVVHLRLDDFPRERLPARPSARLVPLFTHDAWDLLTRGVGVMTEEVDDDKPIAWDQQVFEPWVSCTVGTIMTILQWRGDAFAVVRPTSGE